MANSDYLIAGNDEYGLEPMPTGGGYVNAPEKVSIYRYFAILY